MESRSIEMLSNPYSLCIGKVRIICFFLNLKLSIIATVLHFSILVNYLKFKFCESLKKEANKIRFIIRFTQLDSL